METWLHSNSVPHTSHSLGGSPPQLPVMKLLFFLHFCTKQLTSCLCSPHSSANNNKLNIGLSFLQTTLAISSKGRLPSTINHVLHPVRFSALSSIKKNFLESFCRPIQLLQHLPLNSTLASLAISKASLICKAKQCTTFSVWFSIRKRVSSFM